MSLTVAVGVPYHVEISATGIPLHEAKVEFCIPKNDVSFNFPAKAITDNEYVFTVTDAVNDYVNSTLDYKLYVYYGNARFEADTGSFNLIDKAAFDVKMKKPEEKKLGETIRDKAKNIGKKKDKDEVITEEVEVTPTPDETETPDKKPKVKATKPTPTPTIEPTTTLKEAKDALKKKKPMGMAKLLATEKPVKEGAETTPDANDRVKNILKSIDKEVTPVAKVTTTPDATEPAKSGVFFAEVDRMREINEQRKEKKEQTQRVRDAIKKAESKSKTKKK